MGLKGFLRKCLLTISFCKSFFLNIQFVSLKVRPFKLMAQYPNIHPLFTKRSITSTSQILSLFLLNASYESREFLKSIAQNVFCTTSITGFSDQSLTKLTPVIPLQFLPILFPPIPRNRPPHLSHTLHQTHPQKRFYSWGCIILPPPLLNKRVQYREISRTILLCFIGPIQYIFLGSTLNIH